MNTRILAGRGAVLYFADDGLTYYGPLNADGTIPPLDTESMAVIGPDEIDGLESTDRP